MLGWLLLLSSAAAAANAQPQPQQPLNDGHNSHADDHYKFQWPIKRVAIIGAGVGGLVHYRELTASGVFDAVRVFERDDAPGGNWHYTEEVPLPASAALGTQPNWWTGDYEPTKPPNDTFPYRVRHYAHGKTHAREELERKRLDHRAPKPVWENLEANTPAPQQQIPGFAWPVGVKWATHHTAVARYLRSFASWLGGNSNDVHADFAYNTRVETVTKRFNEQGEHRGWTLLLRKFVRIGPDVYDESWWEEHFDAVVVASGRFAVPNIPAIPGVVEWQERFPDRVFHGRQYRHRDGFEGRSVLVVGAGPTASEISRDVNYVAAKSYISVRPAKDSNRKLRRFHLSRLQKNTTFVGEIRRFHPLGDGDDVSAGNIELVNGTILSGIDTIIFGTGYRYAFPFLSQYHNSSVRGEEIPDGAEQPLVTDGTHVRSVWKDFLYIDQPTLAFSNLNVGIQTFSWSKYTGTLMASIWSGKVKLPTQEALWKDFWDTVEDRGGLKSGYQWLDSETGDAYLADFISRINEGAVRHGGKQIDTPPDSKEVMALWIRARYAEADDEWSADLQPSPRVDEIFNKDFSRAELDDW